MTDKTIDPAIAEATEIVIQANKLAQATDDLWQKYLVAKFGKEAGDVRYVAKGKGEDGSVLRTVYNLRTEAQKAWEAAREARVTIENALAPSPNPKR